MAHSTLQKYDCDRCGLSYKKSSLRRQRGLLLCNDCKDNLKKLHKPNPRWFSPRDNSDSTDAVNTPTIFEISASTGVTGLSQSREYAHEGGRRHFHMDVVSDGGAITVVASPAIVAGLQGDVLTLTGTSDTNTIKFTDSGGLALNDDKEITLKDGTSITFVYNASASTTTVGWGYSPWGDFDWGSPSKGWVECSRTIGGL